jgi:outer membrane protein OmpA-like peptidoglycan-associated protein
MPASRNVKTTKHAHALPRILHVVRHEGVGVENGRLWNTLRRVVWIFAGAGLLFTANGCIATRSWVEDQLKPITRQLSATDAKADQALAGLQNLRLERRLVLDSRDGPTFAVGSSALTENAERKIDGFVESLQGSANSGSVLGLLFVVAGHTDNVGAEDYNYELGRRRAEKVAGYLIYKEGVDPKQVRVVSYGASKPIADNSRARGRRSNRRVEILVYQEKIVIGS